jgi:chemotaxis protein CheZ
MASANQATQLEAARALVEALEKNDEIAAEEQLTILAKAQESHLFKEVGKLTR